jgi:hypothetical protein
MRGPGQRRPFLGAQSMPLAKLRVGLVPFELNLPM